MKDAAFNIVYEDVQLLDEPFDPQEILKSTTEISNSKGGVASFVGYVSSEGGVEALELTHYEPLTWRGMQDLAIAAETRFALKALTIIHRVGEMQPGDPIVLVAAASRHRRDAIAAVDFCMDHLKSAAWFWKREKRADGWHWIEPRDQDHEDLARWDAKNRNL